MSFLAINLAVEMKNGRQCQIILNHRGYVRRDWCMIIRAITAVALDLSQQDGQ